MAARMLSLTAVFVHFLSVTPAHWAAVLQWPSKLPYTLHLLPSLVKEQLVAVWQLIYYDGSLRLAELFLHLGRSCW